MAGENRIRWRSVIVTYVAGAIACAGMYFAAQTYFLRPTTRAAPTFASPVAVNATGHDFGRVLPGSVLKHTFTVRNHGRQQLVLHRVEGCGCGENAGNRTMILSPGDLAEIPVTLEAGVKPGPVRHVLAVTTSDPRQPRLEFALSAQVMDVSATRGTPTEAAVPQSQPTS